MLVPAVLWIKYLSSGIQKIITRRYLKVTAPGSVKSNHIHSARRVMAEKIIVPIVFIRCFKGGKLFYPNYEYWGVKTTA